MKMCSETLSTQLNIRKKLHSLLLLLLVVSLSCSGKKEEVYLVKVGERKLTLNDIFTGEGEMPSPSYIKEDIQAWLNDELLFQEAKKLKLDKDPEVKREIEESIRQVLVEEYTQKVISPRIKITEKEIEDYYAAHSAEFVRTNDEVFLRHILVHDESKANEVKEKLASGADFASVARQYSEDGYGFAGGELGFVPLDNLPPEVKTVCQKAKTGVFYGPIKSSYGYHFVIIEDFRAKGTPKDIKEVHDEIDNIIYTAKYDSIYNYIIDSLKNVYKVELNQVLIDSLVGKSR